MEEEAKPGWLKWTLGAVGLGAVAGSAAISLWIALAILLLAILLFGGLLLLRWWSRKRAGGKLIRGVGQESGQAVSEAEKKAELDNLLQRFKTGLKEFDRAGYSIYEYPWFVVIGESGAGKTEAVRSALEDTVPSSVRHHIPPRDKGTKDFVWWFTKHGIVLDTAGRMVVGEGGASKDEAWRLFLESLRKSRPRCPINGLLLALSAESLIKDSQEKISDKATQLAQKIEMIQRVLDVRFPVYLLVTKCDLLTGFREFTDKIEDPQLQHQIFGWSNPDPLDQPMRPELVRDHLLGVVEQVKRRRLALLRPSEGGGRLGDTSHFLAAGYKLGQAAAGPRHMDEMDSLFAFPESLLLLAPRLRRYLETIFVAGPFSPKPVFLRGIYFTSAMREGRALDEAMSLITGVPLEQLPEDRFWERNKSFFLRDLFVEKVVPEKGLVTRAKNTLKVLRQRRFFIFGTAAVAMLLLLGFAWFGYHKLDQSAQAEARFWRAAAANWSHGEWSPPIVKAAGGAGYHFLNAGEDSMPGFESEKPKLTVAGFHGKLRDLAESKLPVPLVFRPVSIWSGGPNKNRVAAQRAVLMGGVIAPLFNRARDKMRLQELNATDAASLQRHQDALLELIRLEAAALKPVALDSNRAEACLRALLSYLTETNAMPDTNLVQLVAGAYRDKDSWPARAANLLGGSSLTNNLAIAAGLEQLKKAGQGAQRPISTNLSNLQRLVDALSNYSQAELLWSGKPSCTNLDDLQSKRGVVMSNLGVIGGETNLIQRYEKLKLNAFSASASSIAGDVTNILAQVPESLKPRSIVKEVADRLQQLSKEAVEPVVNWYSPQQKALMETLDKELLAGSPLPVFESRWRLYTNACALRNAHRTATLDDVGQKWQRYKDMKILAADYGKQLQAYSGQPLSQQTTNACNTIANQAVRELGGEYVQNYADVISKHLQDLGSQPAWDERSITNARVFFAAVSQDLQAQQNSLDPEDQKKLEMLAKTLPQTKETVVSTISSNFDSRIGFPIILTSANAKKAEELVQLRKLAGLLTSELNDTVWGGAGSELRKKCEVYAPILNMLIDTNGNATEWKLSFVAPARNSSNETIITVFRVLRGSDLSLIPDLTKVSTGGAQQLGTLRADSKLTLEFLRTADERTSPQVQLDDWWLPRLVAERGDTSWEGGGSWRFRIPLEDREQKLSGDAIIEAKPNDPSLVLPKYKDWKGGGN